MTRKASVLEHDIQASFFNWVDKMALFDRRYKNIFAVPNARAGQLGRMKKEGLKSGVPDVVVAYPSDEYHGIFFEFKSQKGSVSETQKDWIERLRAAGYLCLVLNNWEDAVEILKKYLGAQPAKGSKPTTRACNQQPNGGICEV